MSHETHESDETNESHESDETYIDTHNTSKYLTHGQRARAWHAGLLAAQ